MFKSDSHLVRSIFRSHGLWGPFTREQLDYNYALAGTSESAQVEKIVVVTYNGAPLKLHNDGSAFLIEDVPSFDTLDDVLDLAKLMAESAGTTFRIVALAHQAITYNGQLLTKDKLTPALYDRNLTTGFELKTSVTRRQGLRIEEIVYGPMFNWDDFAAGFDTFISK